MNAIQCKLARIALGWGVRELAQAANVSTQTISRLERGDQLRNGTLDGIRQVHRRCWYRIHSGRRRWLWNPDQEAAIAAIVGSTANKLARHGDICSEHRCRMADCFKAEDGATRSLLVGGQRRKSGGQARSCSNASASSASIRSTSTSSNAVNSFVRAVCDSRPSFRSRNLCSSSLELLACRRSLPGR